MSHVLPEEFNRDANPYDRFLNTWLKLPGYGGNMIMLRPCAYRERPLLMFPRLEKLGLEMCFYPTWHGQGTIVIEIDILKPCPQVHIWVFCAWCRKFHLPYDGPGSHRQSRSHEKARQYLDTAPAQNLRERTGFMHVEGRCL